MKNLILLFLLISSNLIAQNSYFQQNKHIYDLDKKIRTGDFQVFIEIGNYFDSKETFIEFLGHHIISTNESNVAKRIVRENSFFLPNEISIDSTMTSKQFKDFLIKNQNKIIFSDIADAFIITPFDNRKTKFEIIELTENKSNLLDSKKEELLNLDWLKQNNIDKLIEQKNPIVLLKLSSILLKNRYRFNEYKNNQDQIINLIQLLTKLHIAVPDETGKMNYHLEEDFYKTSKVNLVIFFANNYKDYKWDENKYSFVNTNLPVNKTDTEMNLFDLLSSKIDTVAINSFIELTQLNSERVFELSEQYERSGVRFNYKLPTFAYRFLKQLVFLTDYCKQKDIDFKGNFELQNSIELLKSNLTFSERRNLEDKLINILTLDEITAFEYWSLVYEKDWRLTYSAGRILDKFYSKNWNKLISNPDYLETYLLKSRLFDDLGIIGFCNNYLTKFTGTSDQVDKYLKSLKSTEPKVIIQKDIASETAKKQIVFKEEEKKDWYGNIDKKIKNFDTSFKKIMKKSNKKNEFKKDISYLLSQISYSQIGEALDAIKSLDIEEDRLYSFMNRDFGFSFIGNFENSEIRDEFLNNYSKLDEYNLYRHYLLKYEVDFTDSNNNLDFDKIYEILKFDINSAFAGGGGSTKDNSVYAIIKLLELNFNTTLSYPKKLCSSNNMYACNSRDRANAWMNYLQTNQYLKKIHDEPVSFAYQE